MAGSKASVRCAENEAAVVYLQGRQRELCGEWDGALTRAFRLAIASISDHPHALRSLNDASKLRNVGPAIQRQLKAFFAASKPTARHRPPTPPANSAPPAGSDSGMAVGGGAMEMVPLGGDDVAHPMDQSAAAMPDSIPRKPPKYSPKRGSAAYTILITLLLEKVRGRQSVPVAELMAASRDSNLLSSVIRFQVPTSDRTTGGAPLQLFACGWSSMETLAKHNLVLKIAHPPSYTLSEEGHAVAVDCLRRSKMPLPPAAAAMLPAAGRDGGAAPLARQAVEWSAHTLNDSSIMLDLPGSVGAEGAEEWQLPPLGPAERFTDAYDVIIFIDNRESECHGPVFANQLSTQFGLATEVHALPAGDAMWVARQRGGGRDYVLDFIVEFTRAHDLWMAIKSSRFRDQRLRLQRCGVRRLLCLVDGSLDDLIAQDPNRAAMIQAEMQEGVDIQQTASLHDTKHRYLDISTALARRYNDAAAALQQLQQQHAQQGSTPPVAAVCPLYSEFVATCRAVQSDSVANLFGHMLLQVRSVTVDVAIAILRRFPSLRALINAYHLMEGNPEGQWLLLTRITVKGRRISEAVSRKVYELVWT
ncbi:hypothetical protein CLOM_g10685 [Closterium sp. NIES-68]|nr:hypothetical protein CLOM_g10685 [Closterium sp. NIES-68]GJP60034.1 hypothetical protein CLOP_g17177 [Closterium sp. NIES-67]